SASATVPAATSSDRAIAGRRAFLRCGVWRCGTAATPSAGAAAFVLPESSIHVGPIMTPAVTRLGITAAYVAIVLLFMLMGRRLGNALFRFKRTNQPPNLALSVRAG